MIRLALIAFLVAGAAPRPAQIIPAVAAVGACPRGAEIRLDPARTSAPYRVEIGKALIGGVASWTGGVTAAGPALRKALGPSWRGSVIRVCRKAACVRVVLRDWCQCYRGTRDERLIDLNRSAFSRLADPAEGLVKVTIELP